MPGCAVFQQASRHTPPLALRYNVEYNRVLHEQVVIFTASTVSAPHVPKDERVHVDNLRYKDDGIVLLSARFGFQDHPDVPATLRLAAGKGLEGDLENPAYFLSRISILPKRGEDMAMWRKRLFAFMSRNAASPVRYFNLPEERVISMGTTIVL